MTADSTIIYQLTWHEEWNCSSTALCRLSSTDASSDSSLHKILRKRDGNILLNCMIILLSQKSTPVKDVLENAPLILLPDCASIQWQELVLSLQSPLLPSPRPRLRSSWRNWAEPRGNFGTAVDQTYSSGLCSLCTWDLMSRWGVVQISSVLLKSLSHTHTYNKNRNQSPVELSTWLGFCETELIHITKRVRRYTTLLHEVLRKKRTHRTATETVLPVYLLPRIHV